MSPVPSLANVLDHALLADEAGLAAAFQRRDPFRNLVVDAFFRPEFAQRLLAEFPGFESGNARNEAGQLGGKSVHEHIRTLGPAFAELHALIQTPEFLGWLSRVTGIPDLLFDPDYYGGGTHDNRDGQDLDSHVDFNRHPGTGWHRRLNLIVYLNPDWHEEWGGALELRKDPRVPPTQDEIKRVLPAFNRGVVFETTEWSWHGFSKITLGGERDTRSRRSVALYFYTRERPAEELAGTHSTVYVDRPLPEHWGAGYTLSSEDAAQLQLLVARRDQHIQRLYRDVQDLMTQLDEAHTHVHRLQSERTWIYFAKALRRRWRQWRGQTS